ncbi:hypothetical protein [Kineobactrum salinum]|uniref:Lipoprotein n=1 Tax=Kineobactrum salinum TaxID=2708301 RepID=A0A6C0U8E6_9GAMM|nr:hypothetical protein [Kineobactrum salinum]QIB67317.1 hypothetical protein G3T16_19870 [Kineobactrum salinum]
MMSPMNKLCVSLLGTFVVGACHATSIDKQEVRAAPSDLKELGLSVGIYPEPLCAEASDVEISIPASHNGASFSGATLDIEKDGETMLSVGLILIEAPETIYSEKPLHGVSFCLHPSLYNSASVRLFYSKGELTTDSILLEDFGSYASH